jgi:hypothetical protein
VEIIVQTDAKDAATELRLKASRVAKAVRNTMTPAEREALREFRRTTDTWKTKPSFEALEEVAGDAFTLIVGTDDPIYRFVDLGTKPHDITGNPLAFQWGGPGSYTAKTVPGVIGSRKGGPSGGTVFVTVVHHPGTKARHFTPLIQAKIQKLAVDLLDKKVWAEIARR